MEKKKEYHHNFLTPRTPQQNGVVERKRQSFKKLVRTILNEFVTPKCF